MSQPSSGYLWALVVVTNAEEEQRFRQAAADMNESIPETRAVLIDFAKVGDGEGPPALLGFIEDPRWIADEGNVPLGLYGVIVGPDTHELTEEQAEAHEWTRSVYEMLESYGLKLDPLEEAN